MRFRKSIKSPLTLLLVVALLLACTPLAWAGINSWTIDPSPYEFGGNNYLFGVAAQSSDKVAAVGSYEDHLGVQFPLALRFAPNQQPRWAIVQTPNVVGHSELFAAAAVHSQSDWQMWAVGYQGGYFRHEMANGEWTADTASTLIERSTDGGKNWYIVQSTNPGTGPGTHTNILKGVAGTSTNDVWAVGYYLSAAGTYVQTLVEHWDGSRWSTVTSPNVTGKHNYLTAVAAISADNAWAVGYAVDNLGQSETLVLRWNGTEWSRFLSANPSTQPYLYGVTCSNADNCWAVGTYLPTGDTTDKTLVLKKEILSWSQEVSPNQGATLNRLYGAANVSANYVWSVGKYKTPTSHTLTVRRLNTTGWELVSSPNADNSADNVLRAVAVVPGTTELTGGDVWAVGYYSNTLALEGHTLIEQYTLPGTCCSP